MRLVQGNQRLARYAGWLYLAIIACGIFSEAAVRMRFVDFLDAAATAANIAANIPLFRAGLAADMVMLLCDVGVAVLLYVLFRPVNQLASLAAAAFRLVHASMLGANLLNYHGALLVLTGEHAAGAPDADRNASALHLLDIHRHGYDLALVFFAVSLLSLGYLITKSALLPRLLGYGLYAAGAVYLIGSTLRFFAPEALPAFQPLYLVCLLAELALGLWLVVKGVKADGLDADGGGIGCI
jgi:hypothetical protein